MRYLALLGLFVLSGFSGLSVFADDAMMAGTVEHAIAQKIKQAVPQIPIVSVNASDFAGMYDVTLANGEHLFATADGSVFIAGDMYRVNHDGLVNLTENTRSNNRADKLASMSDNEKIIFSPENKKVSVTVFTDSDCGYCRKLHADMPGYLAKGIEIKYVAFPRAGIGSSTYDKMVSAWCADDRKTAMNQIKAGRAIPSKVCDNPVAAQYRLGKVIGIRGTPAIVLESGELLSGYYPPEKLAEVLKL
jgi:thiol:disulfide interchange protein DsbC